MVKFNISGRLLNISLIILTIVDYTNKITKMKYIFLLLALTQEFFCKPHTYVAYMSPMKPITRNHMHRQRREDTKTNYIASEHEKDSKKSFSDARLLMIGPDSV